MKLYLMVGESLISERDRGDDMNGRYSRKKMFAQFGIDSRHPTAEKHIFELDFLYIQLAHTPSR